MKNDTNYEKLQYEREDIKIKLDIDKLMEASYGENSSRQEETYLLCDEKQLGPGFFIVTRENNSIKNFINISLLKQSFFSQILVRGYEKNLSQLSEEGFQTIKIPIRKDNLLFHPLNMLSKKLMGRKISAIDPYNCGKNYIKFISSNDEITIIIAKDITRVSDNTNFVDITLADTFTCLFYNDMLNFYNELSKLVSKSATERDVKQLLLTK